MVAQDFCVVWRQADRITLLAQETSSKLKLLFCIAAGAPTDGKKEEALEQRLSRGEEFPRSEILISNWLILKWLTLGKFAKEPAGNSSDTMVTGAPPLSTV